ncbi:glutathione S-transferase family protein [Nannocystaceae bacterium ST9]
MSETITFYHNPMSRGRIAHWMLEEVGASYETKILDWEKREHKSPEYLAINPMGKIPTIVHRGVVVTEVAAILAYLADAFPAAGLAPAHDDPQRGTYYRWLFFAAGCVETAMLDKSLGREIPADKKGAVGYGSYEDTMAAVEQAIAPGFVLGDRFSAADLYLGSQLGYGLMFKMIEPTPSITAYVERGRARPAFQRVMAAFPPR